MRVKVIARGTMHSLKANLICFYEKEKGGRDLFLGQPSKQ